MKRIAASLLFLIAGSTAWAIGQSTTQVIAGKIVNGSGSINVNSSGAWTIPNATDQAVGRATTDTLTNKTISGASNTFSSIPNSATTGTALPTASTLALRDSNGNSAFNNRSFNYATTATAGGTTTLTVASAFHQYFTGTTTQALQLPDATTLPQTGFGYHVVNLSTGAVTIKDAGSNTLATLAASSFAFITVTNVGSANGSWDVNYSTNGAGGGTVTSVGITGPSSLILWSNTPVTTSGSLTGSLATQTANLGFYGPSSGAAAAPTFRAPVPLDLTIAANNQTASYSLTSTDYFVKFSGLAGAVTATLPDATAHSGQHFFIANADTTQAHTVTVNTILSQTIGGRASGSIVLAGAFQDWIHVYSDAANWQIVGKKETNTLNCQATISSIGATGSGTYKFFGNGCSISLTYGIWRLKAWAGIAMGAAATTDFVAINPSSGIYAADASSGGQAGAPTALSPAGSSGFLTALFLSPVQGVGNGTGGSNILAQTADVIVSVTSTTTVYSILDAMTVVTTGNTGTVIMTAERL